MKRNILTTALVLLCALACFAAITDLAGKWKGDITMQDGNQFQVTYNFKVDGAKLTGSCLSPQGELPIYEGKLLNDKDFTFKVDADSGPVPTVGKFYGDSVTIVADLNGEKLRTTLKRVVVKQ